MRVVRGATGKVDVGELKVGLGNAMALAKKGDGFSKHDKGLGTHGGCKEW